jgi:hypothetical protein
MVQFSTRTIQRISSLGNGFPSMRSHAENESKGGGVFFARIHGVLV